MSGSVESDRVIQLHFRRKATDDDRKWLLEAINEKLATDSAVTPSPGPGEPDSAFMMQEVLDFLNSIEGAGYGGMASFEIVRGYVRDLAVSSTQREGGK
jgi:hypothetical protein